MKKLITIIILLLPLVVVGQSSLYNRFAKRSNLTVAQVVGFRLNDTVSVDVLILVADNDKAWQQLKEEFDIRTDKGSTSWLGEPALPAHRTKWTGKGCCKVIASHEKRTLCIYTIKNQKEYDALLEYQFSKIEKQ